MPSDLRRAIIDGHERRKIELLEAIAEAAGAAVEEKEQCPGCGEWYKNHSAHRPHCSGPGE